MAHQKQGKTQAEVAAMVGVSQKTVENWEHEKDDGNNSKSTNASTPDSRTSIGKKEYETAKGVGGGAFGA